MKFRQSLLIFLIVSYATPHLYAPYMTITQTGDYDISGDANYTPVGTNDTIVQISASNVSLNLGGHTLTQSNLVAGLTGITVSPNLTNVSIKNGYIQNITGTGIGIGQGCARITIDNIATISCDNRAINISGLPNSLIRNSVVKNCAFLNNCQGAAADNVITLSHCVNVQIKDCTFTQNSTSPNTLDVAELATCTRCEIIGCEALDTIATLTAHCFNLNNAHQCIIKGNIINSVRSVQSDSYGIEIDGLFNLVESNLIENIFSSATTSSNTVAGISLKSTASGNQILENKITNSLALDSTSSNVFVYGIQMQNILNTITSTTQFVTGVTLNAVAWSPTGRYVATGENAAPFNLRVFEYVNNTLVQSAPSVPLARINAIAWSPDGNFVAAGTLQTANIGVSVFKFDGTNLIPAGTFAIAGGTNEVFSISWSPDGRFIAVGLNVSPQVRVIEPQVTAVAATAIATFVHGATVNSVSWSADGKYIAMGGIVSGGVTTRVLDFTLSSAATTVLSSLANFDHGATVNEVAFSPSARFLAQGGAASGAVTLRALAFNGSSLTSAASRDASTGATVNASGWSADGRFLVSGQQTGGGNEVQVFTFDGTTLVQAQTFSHGSNVNSLDWSVDGEAIAIGGAAGVQQLKILTGLTFPKLCTVRENHISNIRGGIVTFGLSRGIGISASGAQNVIVQNSAFSSDINYRFTKNVFLQFLVNTLNTQPSNIANLSFPPL